jgi:hypothetical protein
MTQGEIVNRPASAVMTPGELERYIGTFSYKPGWKIESAGGMVRVSGDVVCSGHHSCEQPKHPHPTTIEITWGVVHPVPDYVDHVVKGMIDHIERHERAEWLKRDGIPIMGDPHAPYVPNSE